MSDQRKHCWEGAQDADGMSTTCMLERDHRGSHEWTGDDVIVIAFAKAPVGEVGVRPCLVVATEVPL